MNEVYEYRRAPSKAVLWLCVCAIIVLMGIIGVTGKLHLIWMICALIALMAFWVLTPKPVAGIRIDEDHLVLAAWRQPRLVALDDIAYLRATSISADSDVTIVYKDGREEGSFAGDMPDIETLSFVMAKRGVPVRGNY